VAERARGARAEAVQLARLRGHQTVLIARRDRRGGRVSRHRDAHRRPAVTEVPRLASRRAVESQRAAATKAPGVHNAGFGDRKRGDVACLNCDEDFARAVHSTRAWAAAHRRALAELAKQADAK
jgi:hypothetical protein